MNNMLLTPDDNSTDSVVDLSGYVLMGNTVLFKKTDIDHLMSSDDGFIKKESSNRSEDTHSKFFGQNIKRVIEAFSK